MEISKKYLNDFVLPSGEKAKNTYIVDYFSIWLDDPENGELIKAIKGLFFKQWNKFLRDTKNSRFPEYASKIKATDKVATKNHAEYLFLQAFWSPHHDKNLEDLGSWDEDDNEQEIESSNTNEIIHALKGLKKLLEKEYYIPPDGSTDRKSLINRLKISYNENLSDNGYISRLKNDLELAFCIARLGRIIVR